MSTVRIFVCAVLLLPALAANQMPVSSVVSGGSTLLASVRSICVANLSGDEPLAAPAREIAIAALFAAQRYTLTENCDKADAVLKGAVIERAEKRVRAEAEGTDFGVAAGGANATRHSAAGAVGAALGAGSESLMSAETRTNASVTLRLVDKEGTIIWAYTQDSPGGKSKGAIADAMERAVRQLLRAVEKGEKGPR